MRRSKIVPGIIVHGGAWDIPGQAHEAHLKGVKDAARAGLEALLKGKGAVRAVIEAVKVMEDDPAFDAGRGSFLNRAGDVELDAMIMDGSDLSLGAVAAVQNVLHPVELADLVRTRTQHALLVGEGAREFARACGVKLCDAGELLVGREKRRYLRLRKLKRIRIRPFFEGRRGGRAPRGRDTVGAVAVDEAGGIAAATSTGGVPGKFPGRVGDSPIVGAGAYADSRRGGASSTGMGELILRVLMAKEAVDLTGRGRPAGEAARRAVAILQRRVGGLGGIIVIDSKGKAGYAYNTPYMARAVADASGISRSGL